MTHYPDGSDAHDGGPDTPAPRPEEEWPAEEWPAEEWPADGAEAIPAGDAADAGAEDAHLPFAAAESASVEATAEFPPFAVPDDDAVDYGESPVPPAITDVPSVVPIVPASDWQGVQSSVVGKGDAPSSASGDLSQPSPAPPLVQPSEATASALPPQPPWSSGESVKATADDSDIHAAMPPSTIESSNLFGPLPEAIRAERSDIMASPPPGGSPVDSALSFLAQSQKQAETGQEGGLPFEPVAPSGQQDSQAYDYGAMPEQFPEASNILADLIGPEASSDVRSSAVRITDPGMGRTFQTGSSTEEGFDIEPEIGQVPQELEEAERVSQGGVYRSPPSEATMPEMYVDDQEHLWAAIPPPHDPSSILEMPPPLTEGMDLPGGVGTEAAAPAASLSPSTQKDSGVIEWIVDETEKSSIPAPGRSAVIKSSSSSVIPRPEELTATPVTAEPRSAYDAITAPPPAASSRWAWFGGGLLGIAAMLGLAGGLYTAGVVGTTASFQQELAQREQLLQQQRQRLASLEQQLGQLENDRQQAQQTQQKLQAELSAVAARNASLLDKLAAETKISQQLRDNLRSLNDEIARQQDALRKADSRIVELQKQLATNSENQKKLQQELLIAQKQSQELQKQLQTAMNARQTVEKQLLTSATMIQTLAAELRAAGFLPENFQPDQLVAAQQQAMKLLRDRADLAELKRLNEQLAKLTGENAKLKTDQRLMAERHAAELKSLQEKALAERNDLLQKHAAERKQWQGRVEQLQNKLSQAASDTVVLDLWLTIVTGLRRPTDAASALNVARAVLQRVPPSSEEAAMAHLLTAAAFVVQNRPTDAEAALLLAVQTDAYRAARQQGKPWAELADQVRGAVRDPLAGYRRPVSGPPRDPATAARWLDEAILHYRAGRYAEAAAAAIRAVQADAADPLAWYYLGASRWMLGEREAARADFRQGAERERLSFTPRTVIDQGLMAIQGPVRDALMQARP